MSRAVKFSKQAIEEMLIKKATDGVSLEKQCQKKGWKYISVHRAMNRYQLENPLPFALREGRRAMGKIVEHPVELSKTQLKKRTEASV